VLTYELELQASLANSRELMEATAGEAAQLRAAEQALALLVQYYLLY
jgi:hypothetical protein